MDLAVKILMVFGGGGLGAVCRYLLESHFRADVITWIINTLGCLIMGLCFGYLMVSPWSSARKETLYLLAMSGFIGGFSTVAHFALITVNYWRHSELMTGLAYCFFSIVAALLFCWVGIVIGSKLG